MPAPAALPLDLEVFALLNRDGGAFLDAAARLLSSSLFGGAAFLAVALWLWRTMRSSAARPLLSLALAVGLSDGLGSQLLRPLFSRHRPCYALPADAVRWLLPAADVPSVPSLHAANFFAMATVAALADRRLAPAAYAVAALVALSRVYGGVHWPSDVLAGVAWGALCAGAAWALAHRLFRPEGERRPAAPPR